MIVRGSQPPRPGGNQWVRVPAELAVRARKFVIAHGVYKGRDLLGISPCTLDELREEGRLRPAVIARVEARLTELGG